MMRALLLQLYTALFLIIDVLAMYCCVKLMKYFEVRR